MLAFEAASAPHMRRQLIFEEQELTADTRIDRGSSNAKCTAVTAK